MFLIETVLFVIIFSAISCRTTLGFVTPRLRPRSSAFPSAFRRAYNSSSQLKMTSNKLKFVDIGANLLADQFEGTYFGKERHAPDLDKVVLTRSLESGVTHIIVTAGTLQESKDALKFVRRQREVFPGITFGCTVGIHPTRTAQEFGDFTDQTKICQELVELVEDGMTDGSVVALGELGLDYDRLEFSDKESQVQGLHAQFQAFSGISKPLLPYFYHNRNVGTDLLEAIRQDPSRQHGVIHSYTDGLELAQQFIDLGLYIGLNGCSLKTEENLEVVKRLPIDKILLETDCPYCEIKATHASFKYIQTQFPKKPDKKYDSDSLVKGRCEPCQIVQVAEVVAGVKGMSVQEVADQCYQNSLKLYGWDNNKS